MNKTFFLRQEDSDRNWHVIDAADKVVGRLATEAADLLRGKHKVSYTPHTDDGDYVVIINAEKAVLTGNKMEGKEYVWYTGWRSGQRRATPREKMARDHEFVINHAVKGMLPVNRIARQQIKRLKIYNGSEHPHQAQVETSAKKAA
ncbi:MAG: 50S ribosomal protein L13 [Candidatus Dependentiae bacterium]|nr:50S ribosomal protein L13 [Candidatus Dependentiae bacterium]